MSDLDETEDDKMNVGLSVSQRDLLQAQIRELRDTSPPREVWQRIDAQARAEGLFRGRYVKPAKWFGGAGIAAAVALAVLNFPATTAVNDPFPTTPPMATVNNGGPSNLNALMVQSQQIERDLRALPGQPSVVRASTAATIAELEDRIAAIDYRFNHPAIRMSPIEAEMYWRQRVRLMNSLLNLRRAQLQRAAF